MEEIWRPVKDYEGYYEVSNMGNVRSIDRVVERGKGFTRRKSKILTTRKIGGYICVGLTKKGIQKQKRVHRLIAQAFIPNPENKPCIDHINTIKTDNRIENLKWVTYKENAQNPITAARCRSNTYTKEVIKKALETKKRNQKKRAPKTVYQFDKKGNFIAEYYSGAEASRITGIDHGGIIDACNGKAKTAGGYFWGYDKDKIEIKELPVTGNARKMVVFDKNWNIIKEFGSIADASRFTGKSITHIIRATKTKTPKGKYGFRYKEQLE